MSTSAGPEKLGIYQQKLGAKFDQLPKQLQLFHRFDGPKHWQGEASISGGNGILAKIVRAIFGFPAPTAQIDVNVYVTNGMRNSVEYERWERNFGGKIFKSELSLRKNQRFVERFGILDFDIGLDVVNHGVVMPVTGWKIWFLPLHLFLAPISETFEYQDEQGRFCFDVKVTLPLIGMLMHYQGWLQATE